MPFRVAVGDERPSALVDGEAHGAGIASQDDRAAGAPGPQPESRDDHRERCAEGAGQESSA